jgi:hypothetical protein
MAIVVTEESETPPSLQLVERMAFGWWNTSLSPIGKNRADDHHKEIAAKVVKSLIDDFRIDCLGLGEVTNTDLSSMMDACDTKTLGVYEGTLKRGRLQFDTGVIYNIARLAIADSFSTVSTHGERNYKIANRIDFVSLSDGLPLHFFVSHWPSRGTNEETLLSRKTIATRLKDQINAIDERSPGAAVIVMGDFNDEPFDESISWHLLATRDRQLARTKGGYLYNPFWRQLGESQPHAPSFPKRGAAGSCFYKGATDTRWRTYDQILVSSAFLGNTNWHLNEAETTIVRTEFLIDLVQGDKLYFDHLPILTAIERFVTRRD